MRSYLLAMKSCMLGCLVLFLGCAVEPGDEDATASPGLQMNDVEFRRPAGTGEPHLFATADGVALLTWLEPVPEEAPPPSETGRSGSRTHALRLATRRDGAWSEPISIRESDRFFVNWADFPSAVQLADGTIVTHWLERVADAPYAYHAMLSWSGDGGLTWSGPKPAHRDDSPTEHGFVSLVPWEDGAAVVWLDGRAMRDPDAPVGVDGGAEHEPRGDMSLRFTTVAADGTPGPELLLDDRTCECCQTSLVRTSEGLVAAYRNRSEGEIRDIGIVRGTGEVWTEPALVAEEGWQISGCPVNGPQLSASGLRVVSAWFTGAGGEPRVHVAFSEDGGATFGPPIRIDEGTPVGRVDTELMEDGTALVVWLEASEQEPRILARSVSPDGSLGPVALVTETSEARASGFPRVARLGNEILFAWTLPGEDGGIRVRAASIGSK